MDGARARQWTTAGDGSDVLWREVQDVVWCDEEKCRVRLGRGMQGVWLRKSAWGGLKEEGGSF